MAFPALVPLGANVTTINIVSHLGDSLIITKLTIEMA